MRSEIQRLAQERNWLKARLAGARHLWPPNIDIVTEREVEALSEIRSIIDDMLQRWDKNWPLVRRRKEEKHVNGVREIELCNKCWRTNEDNIRHPKPGGVMRLCKECGELHRKGGPFIYGHKS